VDRLKQFSLRITAGYVGQTEVYRLLFGEDRVIPRISRFLHGLRVSFACIYLFWWGTGKTGKQNARESV